MNNKALFGPSGHSLSFFDEGNTQTIQTPNWLKSKGLDLYEYSFGRGVKISDAKANDIGDEARRCGIEMSVHAPYYINFASVEEIKAQNSVMYIVNSVKKLKAFKGERCVFHPGAEGKQPRVEAFARVKDMLQQTLEVLKEEKLDDFIICPETMGKQAQIGTVSEIAELCTLGEKVFPCIDFGHVNSLTGGTLKTESDFQKIIDCMFDVIGEEKTKNMHVHFSKIQFGAKGEIKHLTFEDTIYGPEFEPFAEVIVKNGLTPHIICESNGTQTEDALFMKGVYKSLK